MATTTHRGSEAGMSTMVFEGGINPKSVKRPRPVKSCAECRKRKLKCDRLCPCSQCQKSHRTCKYPGPDVGDGNLSDGSDVEPTERPPKRLTSRPAVPPMPPATPPAPTLNGQDVQQITAALIDEFSGRLDRLERLVVNRDGPGSDWRSRSQGGISTSSSTLRGLTVKGDVSLRTRFFGQNSTRVLLNLVACQPPHNSQ